MIPISRLFASAMVALALFAAPSMTGDPDKPVVGLILKTESNPFFVRMKEAARGRADEFGIELRTYTGQYDGDTRAQVEAVHELVSAGAKGILVTPSDPAALAGAVKQARAAGIPVVALDTPFAPADVADATFATDNFRAGELVGAWARGSMGNSADSARIVTLDGYDTPVTVDILRNQGFLLGFGIDIRDPARKGDEDDARIAGRGTTGGTEEGGRAAMAELLLRIAQNTGNTRIDVVYAINEPAAAGAHAALRDSSLAGKLAVVSIDGGCAGVRSIAAGELGATAMQFPVEMVRRGLDALDEYIQTGRMPQNPPGRDFDDTGVVLVTDAPVPGIPSISSAQALEKCWG